MSNVPIRPDLVPAKSSLELGKIPGSNNQEKQTIPVVKGEVVVKKPSPLKRLASSFVADDLNHVKEFMIYDVIIPAIKDTFMSSLNMLLWGSPNYRGRGGYSNGRNERTSYWSYGGGAVTQRSDRGNYVDRRNQSDIRDLLFETRVDAEEVIGVLQDYFERYGKASVADLYDAAGVSHEHTDINFGWLPGAEFRVRPVSGGYVIDMPRPRAFT